ncbi:hypothetical protein D3C84_972050 [compost metagenome]
MPEVEQGGGVGKGIGAGSAQRDFVHLDAPFFKALAGLAVGWQVRGGDMDAQAAGEQGLQQWTAEAE